MNEEEDKVEEKPSKVRGTRARSLFTDESVLFVSFYSSSSSSSLVVPFFFSLSLSLPTKESADVFFEIFSLSLSLSVFASFAHISFQISCD